jgi:nitrate reductase gamma subunit
MELYLLARGPFVWAACFIFLLGCLYQAVFILAVGHGQGKFLYPGASLKGSLKSYIFGILPFSSFYMRKNPALTIVTVVFHICLFVVPIFLLAHGVLLYDSWKILWWSIPEILADVMTVAVIVACVFFFVRRCLAPRARSSTKAGDFLLLTLIIIPFLTGFLATHQWGPYLPMLITHIIFSEILIAAIPFTRLFHMVFFWVSRAYMGAENSKSLRTGDW